MMKGALGLIGLGLLALTTIVTSQCVGVLNCDNCENPVPKCYECITEKFLKTTGTETTCAACPDNCASCTDETTCDACLPRYMKNSAGACVSCGTNCAECTIDTNNDPTCTKCDTGKYVASGNCESCPSNCDACSSSSCSKCASEFVKNLDSAAANNKKCLACPAGCTTCSGTELTSAATCTACDDDKYLLNGRCPACLDTNCAKCKDDGSCEVDGCNSRFYKKDAQQSCQACSPAASCRTCDLKAGSTTETECSACKEDYGLNTEAICEACDDSNCVTCNGDTGTCTVCKPLFTDVNGVCMACGDHCGTCDANNGNNGVICTACDDTDYIPDSVTGICVERTCGDENCANCGGDRTACVTCEPGYFKVDGVCTGACHADCLTCNGAEIGACLTCAASKYKANTGSADVLIADNTTPGTCLACHDDCLTCDGVEVNACLTCAARKYKADTGNSDVLIADNTTPGTCLGCHADCLTCEGVAIDECLSCAVTKYKANTLSSNVLIAVAATAGTCLPCHGDCTTCALTAVATHCITCSDSGKFWTETGTTGYGVCTDCHDSCATCSVAGVAGCLSCAVNKYKANTGSSNVLVTVAATAGTCLPCHASCATCALTVVATHCITCTDTEKFLLDAGSNNYGTCITCHSSCATCSAENNAATCRTCSEGFTFNGVAGSDGTCLECHASCVTCHAANDPNACLTCDGTDRYYFTEVNTSPSRGTCKRCQAGCNECDTVNLGNKCDVSECASDGYVQAAVSGACLACPEHCDTCTEDTTDVTKCSAGGCSDGYYLKDDVCTECTPHCRTCAEDDAGNLVCSVCLSGFKRSTDQCAECPNDCDECTLENYAMKCTKCAEHKAMDSENACRSCPGQCSECSVSGDVVKCKAGKCAGGTAVSADSTSCDDCVTLTGVDSCATCQDSNSTGYSQCMSCGAGKFLKDDFSECLDRFDSCARSEDRPNECTQCSEGFNVTEDKQCSLTCYTCEGEDCNKAGSPGVSDVCVGTCWVYYNDVDGTVTVTRGCENKICPEDHQEEHCKEVNINGTGSAVTKECEQCCTTNDCNTHILDGVDGDNGSRNLQCSTWLLLAGIIALLTR